MISNTYNRYLWLLNTLLVLKKLSFDDINKKWQESYLNDGTELSLRTFHAHRKAIEEMFGINIKCEKTADYRYYISNSSDLEKDKARSWVINSFNVTNLVNQGQSMKDRIMLEEIPRGSEFLDIIIKSMKKNEEIEVEYKAFYKEETKVYHLHPYCMRVLNQRWYVLGYMKERDALRHISLDRTIKITKTGNTFEYPEDFSPEEYYADSFGIWVNDKLKAEKVVIRAYGQQAMFLETLPLHISQQEIKKGEGYTDYSYHICISHDLVRELMSKCGDIEVLYPEHLRKEMKVQVLNVLNRYK